LVGETEVLGENLPSYYWHPYYYKVIPPSSLTPVHQFHKMVISIANDNTDCHPFSVTITIITDNVVIKSSHYHYQHSSSNIVVLTYYVANCAILFYTAYFGSNEIKFFLYLINYA
jgi:hypothetical protein